MSRALLLICGFVALSAARGLAASPFWNPFASTKEKPVVQEEGTTHLTMSDFSLMPKLSKPDLSLSEPIERINDGTKELFHKTKQVLTPPKLSTPNIDLLSPFRSKPADHRAKAEKKSVFSSWFTPEPEPPRPMTVSDFIGQERP